MKSNKCVVLLSVLTLWILSGLTTHAQIILDAAGTNLTSTAITAGTYGNGQTITINVGWNHAVPLVSGSPTIPMTIGSNSRTAAYASGAGTKDWTFTYTVQSGDSAPTGISLATDISLNGGDIGGADTNLKTTTFATVLVDTTPPTISSVTGPANGTYAVGQTLNFTVNTSEKVNVTGSPQIALTLNSGTVNATYASGSGSTALIFSYTVVSGDSDPDGVALGTSISLNGGTIADVGGNAMTSFTFTAPTTTGVLIDGVPPSINISAPSATYTTTASVTYTVTYSDSNFSSSSLAANKITLNKTGTASGNVGVSGSGTSYTVTISSVSGDGTLGISIASGTATDTAGNTAAAAGPSTTFVVDNTKPSVGIGSPSAAITASSSVSYTVTYSDANFNTSTLTTGNITLNKTGTANGTVGLTGSGTSYTVTISSITGDGTLGISIGAGTASDLAGNTANAAGPSTTFTVDNTNPTIGIGSPSVSATRSGPVTYTVTYSDTHFNSSTLSTGNITLNTTGTATGSLGVSGSGTTRTVTISSITGDGTLGISIASGTASDTAGNTAGTAGPSGTFTVDNTGPTVSSVTGPNNGTYKIGDQLNFTVNFAENVTVSGTPQIGLTIGSSSVNASYVSGSGTGALLFRYTVQSGDLDTDGIACASSITANGGAIKDALGNPMTNFSFSAPTTTGVLVDGVVPTIVSITPPANGYYKAGKNLDFTVAWSENVYATGTPYINVQLDSSTVKANLFSGSGTSTHVFRYTVQAGDNDLTGIVVPINPNTIHATGGVTLKDAAGNSADTTTSAINTSSIFVDTTPPNAPVITGISPDTGYSSTDGITSSQTITISGTAEANASINVKDGGSSIGTTTANGSGNWSLSLEPSFSEGSHDLTATATDAAGNTSSDSTTFTMLVDITAPTIDVSAPSTAVTQNGPVSYTVTYGDDNFYASTLSTSDVSLVTSGTATGTVSVTGSGTTYTVTISSITGTGTIGISIGSGTASDTAGNLAPAAGKTTPFSVSTSVTGKVINLSATSSGWFHSGQTITITVEFNTKVAFDTTGGTPSIALNSGGTAYFSGQSQVGKKIHTFDYTVQQGENTQDLDELSAGALSLNGSTVFVSNSNPVIVPFTPLPADVDTTLPAPGTIGSLAVNENIVIDTAGPTVAVSDPSVPSTFTGPVTFTVTYTDKQFKSSSLSAGDVSLITLGTATGTVSVDSGTGTNRTVTISDISGDGTIAIKIGPNTAVDIVGNQAGCSSVSTSFTVGPQLSIVPQFVEPSIATPFDVLVGSTDSNQVIITGSPKTTYVIQFSTSIAYPIWQYLTTVTTDATGKAVINDPNDGSSVSRFYRTMISFGTN